MSYQEKIRCSNPADESGDHEFISGASPYWKQDCISPDYERCVYCGDTRKTPTDEVTVTFIVMLIFITALFMAPIILF